MTDVPTREEAQAAADAAASALARHNAEDSAADLPILKQARQDLADVLALDAFKRLAAMGESLSERCALRDNFVRLKTFLPQTDRNLINAIRSASADVAEGPA